MHFQQTILPHPSKFSQRKRKILLQKWEKDENEKPGKGNVADRIV
jgi:hypothetical protein